MLVSKIISFWCPKRLEQKLQSYSISPVSEISIDLYSKQDKNEFCIKKSLIFRFSALVVTGILLLFTRWRIMGSKPPIFQPVDNPASFQENFWTRVTIILSMCPSSHYLSNDALVLSLLSYLQMWNYNYLFSLNSWLLLCPEWLSFDWSMGCVPLISSFYDLRFSAVIMLWVSVVCFLWKGFVSSASNDTGRYVHGPKKTLFYRCILDC